VKTYAKSACMLLFVLLPASSSGISQNNSAHYRAALELLEIVNTEKTLERSIDIALSAQLNSNPNLGPYEDVMRNFLTKYMSWSSLKEKFVELYMNEFTEEELREMISFYRTDTGRKAVEKLPILLSKGAELGRLAVEGHEDELVEEMQKRAKELNSGK
jgi:hypothetical protein